MKKIMIAMILVCSCALSDQLYSTYGGFSRDNYYEQQQQRDMREQLDYMREQTEIMRRQQIETEFKNWY